jgi:hypothetical protein
MHRILPRHCPRARTWRKEGRTEGRI